MGGPGSGRRKGGSIRNTKGQAAAAKRVMTKRASRGATTKDIFRYKSGLIKKHPNLKGNI